ncbi:DUF2064 domain-containing protein [bacterium AH-315-J21]|nr:DUF2064 domain-containing protein [bacterium AH-315-J21]
MSAAKKKNNSKTNNSKTSNSKKNYSDTVIAICVQETTEDGSNLNFDGRFDDRQKDLLSQSFTADTLVSALSIPGASVRLFYGDGPETVASVEKIVSYVQDRLAKQNGKAVDQRLFLDVELSADRWGVKMETAIKDCFSEGFKKVIFLGSRAPTLTAKLITQAIDELDNFDAVFGPTVEGRYYLMGMRGQYHTSLTQFDWTEPTIYSDVSNTLTAEGLNWTELEMWYVVEHPEDLEYLVRDINQFRLTGDEITAHETELTLSRLLAETEV